MPPEPQQFSHQSYKLLVTGNSGSGKTSYFVKFLQASDHDRIFIYDHQGELSVRLGIDPAYDSNGISEAIKRGDRFVTFDPSELFSGRMHDGFHYFAELVFEVSKVTPGKKLFAVDEIQQLVDASTVPWELSQVIETGRRRGIDTAFISQQPNIIHNRIRNALTECVTFMHNDERAIKFMVDLGFPEDQLRNLRQFEFISKNLRTGQLFSGRSNWQQDSVAESKEIKENQQEEENISEEES